MSVRDIDARALDDATHAEYDDRVAGVIFEEPSEGFALVAFQIRAPDNESYPNAAHVEAMDAYDKLRRNAHLDEDASPVTVTTVQLRRMPAMSAAAFDALPPPRATRRVASLPYQRLLLKARNLYAMGRHGQGQYDAATVVAHAACEVAITEAMQRLIAGLAGGISNRVPASNTVVVGETDSTYSSRSSSRRVRSLLSSPYAWSPSTGTRAIFHPAARTASLLLDIRGGLRLG